MKIFFLCMSATVLVLYLGCNASRAPPYLRDWLSATTASAVNYQWDQPELCPQEQQLLPKLRKELWQALEGHIHTQAFVNRIAGLLGGAVRIP